LYISQGFDNGWEFDHYEGPKNSDQVGVLDLQNACFCFWDKHVSECVQKLNYGSHLIPALPAQHIDITHSLRGFETMEDNEKAIRVMDTRSLTK
jgi:hypothetical protein